jgi:hypothetical protein
MAKSVPAFSKIIENLGLKPRPYYDSFFTNLDSIEYPRGKVRFQKIKYPNHSGQFISWCSPITRL